jgi:hypothetical protein
MKKLERYKEISQCRFCKREKLEAVISLGEQFLTGIFPKTTQENVSFGPLDVVFCKNCGLLQLKQSYHLCEMYSENYGYRSGLNSSMVNHLKNKIKSLENLVKLSSNDIVLDIGSNDATALNSYDSGCIKVGIDPVGSKFKEFYKKDTVLISDFFSAERFSEIFEHQKAKIITSIAMFYDLEDPSTFVGDIFKCLDEDGIWHFEQSYMPLMLETNSYDTICHEHLEFYSLHIVKNILEKSGLRIIDVIMNDINGGSFAITACKWNSHFKSNSKIIEKILEDETALGLNTVKPYKDFELKMHQHKATLLGVIDKLLRDGKKIIGYGASTKGNVLLQFCGITKRQIPYIAEVNPDKFGTYTPGVGIPIISEKEAHDMNPDYFLVLPWHFKDNILEREHKFRKNGGKFIFPLPYVGIV